MYDDDNRADTGTTVFNKPHKPMVTYSARGYDEYAADLAARLETKGFLLKEDDFLQLYIDLAAYMGEVLTTYENAYVQEMFLETAQLRESLFDLAFMTDYRVGPGSAATGKLVVKAKTGKSGLLPKGSGISGKAENATETVFFETDEDLDVNAAWNAFALTDTERYNEIPITTSITVKDKVLVKPGQWLYFTDTVHGVSFFAKALTSVIDDEAGTTLVTWKTSYPSTVSANTGDGTWKTVKDAALGLLKLLHTGTAGKGDLWIDAKEEGIEAGSPVVVQEGSSFSCGVVENVECETLDVKTGEMTRIAEAGTSDATLSANETKISEYTIHGVSSDKTYYVIRRIVTESREATKLTVAWANTAPSDYVPSPIEKSSTRTVCAGAAAELDATVETPDTASVRGEKTLIAAGDFTAMEKYRTIIIYETVGGKVQQEELTIIGTELLSPGGASETRLTFRDAISKDFTKYGLTCWGNVTAITQGKTASTTVLGSAAGDTAYQAFDIPLSPLTFERSGEDGVIGAIEVRVDDLPWEQKNDFLESGPEDRHYVIETDFEGKSRVVFGDGIKGMRPHTGKNNVTAVFRSTQGTSGNVPDGTLKKALSKPPFLEEVMNPQACLGGTDADRESDLRKKIPLQHITFDRAVSVDDYADLARSFPGIAKAKSALRWRKKKHIVVLAVAGDGGADVTPLIADLRVFLDARRDVNQPLIIKPVDLVPIEITLHALALPQYDAMKVEDAVKAALGTGTNDDGTFRFFNFQRLDLGMSIHKKDLYRVVEQVPGIKIIDTLTLARGTVVCCASPDDGETYLSPVFCPGDVWINNWELAFPDKTALDITVVASDANRICERWGG